LKKKGFKLKDYVIFIVSEEFAWAICEVLKDKSYMYLTLDELYENIDTCWVHQKYKKEIFLAVDKVLRDGYDLSLEEVKKIFSEGKKL